jgi:CelD/BcsL family acetyltransferase involved in cellulose biosynthesis
MELITISDDRDFSSLRAQWNDLLAQSRQDSPFLRHEWLETWWESFGTEHDALSVLICRAGTAGDLVGALPIFRMRQGRLVRAREIHLLGDEHVGSVGLGAFARPDAEAEVAQRLDQRLREEPWDVLALRALDADSPLLGLEETGARAGRVRMVPGAQACPRVALPSDWEVYLAETLGSHSRRGVRRSRRDAEAAGAQLELIEDAAALPQASDDLLRLFECRMRRVVDKGYRVTPQLRMFVARMLPLLLGQGRLVLAFLTIGGERVAVEYSFRYGDTLYGLMSGFEERWAKQAVYKALFGYVVERAIAQGCATLDLGLGDQEHKRGWGVTEVRRFSDLTVYSGLLAGQLRRLEDVAVSRAEKAVLAAPDWLATPLKRAGRAARRFARGR